jgi:hypothetical protein
MRAVYLVLITSEAAAAITIPDRLRHAGYRGGRKDRLCDVHVGGVRGEVPSGRRTIVRERPLRKRWYDRIFLRPSCVSFFHSSTFWPGQMERILSTRQHGVFV